MTYAQGICLFECKVIPDRPLDNRRGDCRYNESVQTLWAYLLKYNFKKYLWTLWLIFSVKWFSSYFTFSSDFIALWIAFESVWLCWLQSREYYFLIRNQLFYLKLRHTILNLPANTVGIKLVEGVASHG